MVWSSTNGQRWRRLTQDDGLIWNDIGEGAFFEDNDGSVWIGTSNGISHILHPASLATLDPLEVVITEVNHGGVLQAPSATHRFDYAANQPLTLRLAALGAPTRHTLQYRYRLRGLERDWVNSDRPQVDYPPLPPGNFTFEVTVYDPDNRQLSPIVPWPLRYRAAMVAATRRGVRRHRVARTGHHAAVAAAHTTAACTRTHTRTSRGVAHTRVGSRQASPGGSTRRVMASRPRTTHLPDCPTALACWMRCPWQSPTRGNINIRWRWR